MDHLCHLRNRIKATNELPHLLSLFPGLNVSIFMFPRSAELFADASNYYHLCPVIIACCHLLRNCQH